MCETEYRVTAIRRSKRVSGRFSVYINRKFAASLTADELADYRLASGKRLTPSEFDSFASQFENRRLRESAYRLLSYRSRSEKEIFDKLRQKGFSREKTEDLIAEFREKGLLSDRRFAEDWVDNRMRLKPRGRGLLVMELIAKGVDKSMAERVVDEKLDGTDETEMAFQLLENRRERFIRENSIDTKRKIYDYLRYRGFAMDAILRAADRFLRQLEEETADINE